MFQRQAGSHLCLRVSVAFVGFGVPIPHPRIPSGGAYDSTVHCIAVPCL
jgi:hypothetical protein